MLPHPLEREANDIAEQPVDLGDDPPSFALRRIGARFVERVDLAKIIETLRAWDSCWLACPFRYPV